MSHQDNKKADFYVVGGTMQPHTPSYIERKADTQLYEHILKGDFCYILTPRQMGKSSLMARTADRLKTGGIQTAVVDLTQIGTEKEKASENKWYYGIAHRIVRELGVKVNLKTWWEGREKLPALQRFMEFFEDVVLTKTDGQVIIFVDEIDTTIKLPFTDDFFAAIRACYNARATQKEYQRLSFVLLGVASPSDLIKDAKRTPFNIGHRIDLTDFTFDEARPLLRGLRIDENQGEKALKLILSWTGGHPYLTQKLCRIVSHEKSGTYSEEIVDELVEMHFLKPGAEGEEPNLKFVSHRLLQDGKNSRKLLKLYQRIHSNKHVIDKPLSPIHASLKLSGLVIPRKNRQLSIRNRIYEKTFTQEWLKQVMPTDWNRNIAVAAISLLFAGFMIYYGLIVPGDYIKNIRSAQNDVPIESYNKLKVLPFYRTTAENLFAQYWDRRALRSERQEKRDEALIYHLKALAVKESKNRRSEASLMIGHDYNNLIMTYPHDNTAYYDYSVALNRDGTRIIIKGKDGTVRIWNADTGNQLVKPKKYEYPLFVAFNPGGTPTVTGIKDGIVGVWDAETGDLLVETMIFEVLSDPPVFNPDGTRMVTQSFDGTIRVWDTYTGTPLGKPIKNEAKVYFVAFSVDGKLAVTENEYGSFRVWDIAAGTPLGRPIESETEVFSIALSPDGTRLAIGNDDDTTGTVQVWDTHTGTPLGKPMKFGFTGEDFLHLSPDAMRVVTGSEEGTVWLWNAETGIPLGGLMRHEDMVYSAAFSQDGTRFLTLSIDGTARLWKVETGNPLGTQTSIKHDSRLTSVALSRNGKRILTGGEDGTVGVWDAETGFQLGKHMKHRGEVYPVDFSPDGTRAVSGNEDGTVRVWDVETGIPLGRPMIHEGEINSVAFSRDGTRIVTGSDDFTAQVWDVETGTPLGKPMIHENLVYSVALSPDEKTLLTGSYDGTVRLWNAETGTQLETKTPIKHEDAVSSVAFSPDGKTLLTGSYDSTVQLWDAETGKPIGTSIEYTDEVDLVAFSPDGTTIMAASGWWIHQGILSGAKIEPNASRMLPGFFTGAYRFSDKKGDEIQVLVAVTGDTIKIVTLRFDEPDAPPIQGDPKELLELWQKKLALKLNEETGEIVPKYPLPSPRNNIRRSSPVTRGESKKTDGE